MQLTGLIVPTLLLPAALLDRHWLDGESPLRKPVRSAILATKPSESGKCRLIRKEIFCHLEHLIRIGVRSAVIGLIGAQKAHTVNAVWPLMLRLAWYEEAAEA